MSIKKPKKRSARKTLVTKLDKVFSLYIRARDKKCVLCGKTEGLTCGHVFSRVAYSVRWDERNAFAQCYGCNLRHEYDPYPFLEYARYQYGQDGLDNLHRDWHTPHKFTEDQLRTMILLYEEKLEALRLN